MSKLDQLLHDMSVVFGRTTSLRRLPGLLAPRLAVVLPVAEVETVRRLPGAAEVAICTYAPKSERQWEGRRSARFLDRRRVLAPKFVDGELARVAVVAIHAKLEIPVGKVGLLSVALETDISVELGSPEATRWFVEALDQHCRRLGQLLELAERCREAHHRAHAEEHRNIDGVDDAPISDATEILVTRESGPVTDIPVMRLDTAVAQCIRAALSHTRGKIYGPGGAAAVLGVKPSTLQSKMLKLGVDRAEFVRASPG